MSINGIFGNGLAGLQAAQAGLRLVSQNISNVNTPGYARAVLDQQPRTLGNAGAGVEISAIRRAVDQFLSAASLNAAASQGGADVRADLLDRAQRMFGDPNGGTSLSNSLDSLFTAISDLTTGAANSLRRAATIDAIRTFLTRLDDTATQIEALRVETEERLRDEAATASTLLSRIGDLNSQIRTMRASGGDSTSAENAQAQLIDQLSQMIDIRVTTRDLGGVEIRTGAGALLVGDTAASITYSATGTPYSAAGALNLIDSNGTPQRLEALIRGGSIAGLIQARDKDLPALSGALGSLTAATTYALNAAHNQNTGVPAPNSLVGRNTGLVSTDRMNFTGQAVIATTNSAGALTRRIDVNFSAGTYSVDGGAAVSFGGPTATIDQFVTGITAALGGFGGISFSNGVLSLNAGAGSNGIVVQQNASAPSVRHATGFSQFFGLNDLIVRDQPAFFHSGLLATENHNLAPGGAFSFRITDLNGQVVVERSVAVTGATWADQIAAINASGTGLAPYASMAMTSGGFVAVTPTSGYRFEVTSDTTARGTTGLSMSSLFGLDRYAQAGMASDMRVNDAIVADNSRLALARPNLAVALGTLVLEAGDNTGALALTAVRDLSQIGFPATYDIPQFRGSISGYIANISGEAGRRAQDAQNKADGAAAIATAAAERRSTVEGVNLDDELVKMTTYQQSYAAASRVIQAAKDMFDILLTLK